MKYLYPLLIGILFIYSCSKDTNDDEDPKDSVFKACFEISKDTISVGEMLQITDCSQGATDYAYEFGNGETGAVANPSVIYQAGGDFNIDLTITNEAMETKTFSKEVHVTTAASKYIFPEITAGFSVVSLETGINPNNGNIYSIELLEDNVGSGGSKFYYNELDASFTVTSNYIADKPFESNSAFVNFYPSGNMNFVFSRTLASLYGTQEITYNNSWGFLNGINSATKHSYGFLVDGTNYLYYGTEDDAGLYKAAIERRNASGDAFEVFLGDFGTSDAMIGDLIPTASGYIAFGALFNKNATTPHISNYKPLIIFYDSNLAVTANKVFDDSVLNTKISSANDLNGSYHIAELTNGNIVMYGNGELIVADAMGNMLSSTYFDGTKNNQALISLGDTFILSSDNYLRKFDASGGQIKEFKYDGNYLAEILEINDLLFFAAAYDVDGEIKMFYGSSDKDLNLIDLNP